MAHEFSHEMVELCWDQSNELRHKLQWDLMASDRRMLCAGLDLFSPSSRREEMIHGSRGFDFGGQEPGGCRGIN